MALFSVNQNARWFTAKATKTDAQALVNVGDIRVMSKGGKVWFEYKATAGNKRSEVINPKNGGYIKYVAAADMKRTLKTWTVPIPTVDGEGQALSTGDSVTFAITIRNYHALGDNQTGDFTFTRKYDSAQTYLAKIAEDINKSDISEILTAVYTPASSSEGTTTPASFVLTEKRQDWIQGLMSEEEVNFMNIDVLVNSDIVSTQENVTVGQSNTEIPNSHMIADMEWFYLGEHGDQQRLTGYPYVNAAQLKGGYYLVDPEDAAGYDLITVHYAYVGNGTFVQKSEQDVIIAIKSGSSFAQAINKAITGNNTAIASKSIVYF